VRHFRSIEPRGLQVYGEASNDASNPFPFSRKHGYGLRGEQQIEDGVGRGLRQGLHAQISVWSDGADHVTRFVHGRDDQAVRFTAANGYNYISKIVCVGREILELAANFRGEFLFIPTNGGRV